MYVCKFIKVAIEPLLAEYQIQVSSLFVINQRLANVNCELG